MIHQRHIETLLNRNIFFPNRITKNNYFKPKEAAKIAKNTISYNLNGNILFEKINSGENILILYHNTEHHQQIFKNIISQKANGSSLLFYLSHTSNKLSFDFKTRNFHFNVINEETLHEIKSQLGHGFQERDKNNQEMVLISDWSRANVNNCPIFLPFLEELIKKSKNQTPAGWERKYGDRTKTKTDFMLINAFETSKLDGNFIQQLVSLHQRVYLLQGNTNTFLLPNLSPSSETIFPGSQVLPQKILEKLTKDNLELITLFFLEKGNKSGYRIIRDIADQFHCILSQGTVYPLLYQLEKQNKIVKQNGKGREIIYSLTLETRNQLQSHKETSLQAYQHLASFFGGGGVDLNKK